MFINRDAVIFFETYFSKWKDPERRFRLQFPDVFAYTKPHTPDGERSDDLHDASNEAEHDLFKAVHNVTKSNSACRNFIAIKGLNFQQQTQRNMQTMWKRDKIKAFEMDCILLVQGFGVIQIEVKRNDFCRKSDIPGKTEADVMENFTNGVRQLKNIDKLIKLFFSQESCAFRTRKIIYCSCTEKRAFQNKLKRRDEESPGRRRSRTKNWGKANCWFGGHLKSREEKVHFLSNRLTKLLNMKDTFSLDKDQSIIKDLESFAAFICSIPAAVAVHKRPFAFLTPNSFTESYLKVCGQQDVYNPCPTTPQSIHVDVAIDANYARKLSK